MFAKLHLLSQDVPEGGDGFRWRAHPYLRMAGSVPKGPVVFDWNARQRADLETLWRDPASEGARERLAKDLAAFCDKLGWTPDRAQLEDAEQHGDEYMLTLSSVPPELYLLPWEVIQVGAGGTYLSDYASAQVRYAMPGLGPREIQAAPPEPGVLFAWSAAGGAVPHEEQAAAIRAAAEAGGVTFRELAEVDEASLQAALDAGPPSVLHLLCHGLAGPEGEPSRLAWGASDSPSQITATRLARMLRRHEDAIRLVVLSACGSGDGRGDPMFMSSLAQELHRKGIPSVVASRYPLSVPGSRVMTCALYDKLLRDAWSLERALRHTRQALFRVDDDGEPHPGDAYGIQLYAYDTEWFVSDNEVEAERPVLASYPFGTPARPVPAKGPPSAELTLRLDADPGLTGDELVDKLRSVSEDDRLIVVIRSLAGRGAISVIVHTTVDGSQRLLSAWRSKALQVALGVIVGAVILTKGIGVAMGATTATVTSKVAASASAAATGGKTTASIAVVAGKAITAKLAFVALATSAAVAAGAVVYRAETRPSAIATTVTDRLGYGAESLPQSPLQLSPPLPEAELRGEQQVGAREGSAGAREGSAGAREGSVGAKEGSVGATEGSAGATEGSAGAMEDSAGATEGSAGATEDSAGATEGSAGAIDAGATPFAQGSIALDAGASSFGDARSATDAGGSPHAVCGNGIQEAGEQCDDGNTRDGDSCSSKCMTEVVAKTIKPNVLQAQLSSGNMDVHPGKKTWDFMLSYHMRSLKRTVALCVNTAGVVTQATIQATIKDRTGYEEYDNELLKAVREWRYRPYLINGTPVSVCSTVEFMYNMSE